MGGWEGGGGAQTSTRSAKAIDRLELREHDCYNTTLSKCVKEDNNERSSEPDTAQGGEGVCHTKINKNKYKSTHHTKQCYQKHVFIIGNT